MENVHDGRSPFELPRGVNAIDDPTQALFRQFYPAGVPRVGPTDGSETFATAGGVFTAGITHDFFNQDINVPGPPTVEQNALIYEATRPITKFHKVYDRLGPLDKICWRQSQGVEFFKHHADKLCDRGHSNFLPFLKGWEEAKEDGSNVVVALVVVVRFHCLKLFLLRLIHVVFDETLQQRIIIPQRLL